MYNTRIELAKIQVTKSHNEYTNVIKAVRYNFVVINENGDEVKFEDVTMFKPHYSAGFTPIDELTEDTVISWIEKHLHPVQKQQWIEKAQAEFDKPKQDLID